MSGSVEFPGNSPTSPSPALPFAELLRQVIVDRFGKPGDPVTAKGRIIETMIKGLTDFIGTNAYDKKKVPGGKTLEKWCKRQAVPYFDWFEPVLAFLFDGRPDDPDRERLRSSWDAADRVRPNSSGKARTGGTLGFDEPDPTSSDFDAEDDPPLQAGLAELRVEPPPRGGNAPNMVPIRVSLSFAECDEMVEHQGVTLALTDAALVPSYPKSCAPVLGSRAGEAENPKGDLREKSGHWVVAGPKAANGHLISEPLEENQRLLALRVSGAETDGLSLTLRSKSRALVVIPDEPEDDARVAKDKMLQLPLQRCQEQDKDGWVIWGRARLRRKKPVP